MNKTLFTLFFAFSAILLVAQDDMRVKPSAFIDEEGIVRWTENKEEVCHFGTNYSVPFSYWNWRKPIGYDQEKAIDEDVYHIARMGLDAYRIHVWDSYICDSIGDLVYNEHFRLYDYLQYKLKQRGIKMFITPMNHSSDSKMGFASYFRGKNGTLSDTTAFRIQENYLIQFLNHVNPYTGIAYKDDPDIVAFGIINEPHHGVAPQKITTYINRMYDAMRSTGMSKPIFYNMTTSCDYIDDILASKVQGGTFQWYPSGLTCNHDLKGNLLPNVDQYHIPYNEKLKAGKYPKFVYEFSPSDIGKSATMYVAMARSFREAGFQFAAHFAYDPLHAAYCNIEYRTHFLNLAYTPKKAIGMMIASEAFHAIPLNKSYGRFPKNNQFESFTLDAEKDLAEMLTDKKFLYSNSTITIPEKPEKLEQIAGTGNSSIVKYSGTGVYFLDKLEEGVWRLEVMPDAFWLSDPFFVPYIDKEIAITVNRCQNMQIALPCLGEGFSIKGLNEGNDKELRSEGNLFTITPGAYLLTKAGEKTDWNSSSTWKNIRLGEFHIPERVLEKTYVLHQSPGNVNVGEETKLTVKVISPEKPEYVEMVFITKGGGKTVRMLPLNGYDYQAQVPAEFLGSEQVIRYHIQVKEGDEYVLFPGGEKGDPVLKRRTYSGDQLLDHNLPYRINVMGKANPVCLFDAEKDWHNIVKMRRNDKLELVPASIPGKSMLKLSVQHLNIQEHNHTIGFWCTDRIESRFSSLNEKKELVIYGKALNDKACKMQVSLLLKNGAAFGGVVELNNETAEYKIKLNQLKPVKSVLLPRTYPKFHLYWFEPSIKSKFDIEQVESIQLSIGPDIPEQEYGQKHGVLVGWVSLQ